MIRRMSESTPSGPAPLPDLPHITPGRYRHYKGLDYEVLGVVRHSETLAPMVLYRPLYQSADPASLWVRPFEMFVGTVETGGLPVRRFAPT